MNLLKDGGPRWVWTAEVADLIEHQMSLQGLSLGALARRAGDRFGDDPDSVERRLRAARRSGGVMNVHTADRYLVLLGCHLTDLPTYRMALAGTLPPEAWPRRGAPEPQVRPAVSERMPVATGPTRPLPIAAAAAAAYG